MCIRDSYFTLRAVGTSTGLLIVGVILLASRHDSATWGVVMFVAAAKAVESFTDVIAGLLQKHERLDQVAISMMLKGLSSLAAFALTFLRFHSIVYASAAMAATWLVVFCVYDLRVARRLLRSGEQYFVWDRQGLI